MLGGKLSEEGVVAKALERGGRAGNLHDHAGNFRLELHSRQLEGGLVMFGRSGGDDAGAPGAFVAVVVLAWGKSRNLRVAQDLDHIHHVVVERDQDGPVHLRDGDHTFEKLLGEADVGGIGVVVADTIGVDGVEVDRLQSVDHFVGV